MSEYPNYGEILEVECRIAWPQIGLSEGEIEKRAAKRKGKAKKYKDKKNSVTALIKKTAKDQLRAIFDACTDVSGVDSVNDLEKWPLANEDGDLRDGDDEAFAEFEGYPGCYFFKTGTDQMVDMAYLDDDGEIVEVEDPETAKKIFYPGANCLLVLQVCEWDEGQVTFYLKGIMRLDSEGKRLGDSFDARGIFQKHVGKGKGKSSDKASESKPKRKKNVAAVLDDDSADVQEPEVVGPDDSEDGADEPEVKRQEQPKTRIARKKKSDISSILD